MIPEGKEIAYECENGHVNAEHSSAPKSADKDFQAVCIDCGGRLTRTLVPLYECADCGNVWAYTGNADRPTCSNCRGKRVEPVAEGSDHEAPDP